MTQRRDYPKELKRSYGPTELVPTHIWYMDRKYVLRSAEFIERTAICRFGLENHNATR